MHHQTMKKVWCKIFLVTQNIKKTYRSLMQSPEIVQGSAWVSLKILGLLCITWPATKCLIRGHDKCSLLLRWEWTDRHSPLDVCLLVLIKKRRARKSIQSCSWSSTNHKNSSLQLSQIDSHLCAVTGFPHPDLHKGEREGQGGKCWGEKGEKSHSNMQPNNSRCSDLTIRISVTQAAQINHLNPFSLPPLGICNLCRKSSNTSDFTNLTFHSNQSSRIIAFMAMLGKSKVCSCYSS